MNHSTCLFVVYLAFNYDKNDVIFLKTLSIVVPSYNEGTIISQTALRITKVMQGIGCPYQIVFVDDGSRDDTWLQITLAAQSNPNITGIKLSKNFGKEGAILAGLENACGDAIVVIDCDLQHPPEVIAEMYRIWVEDNADVVEGVKVSRGKESKFYKFFANIFYAIIKKIGSVNLRDLSDFQLLDRRVVNTIINLPERQRFFRALSSWTGFNRAKVPFHVEPRQGGHSKFGVFKLFKYAVTNITSFSTLPLQIVTFFGFVFFIGAVVLGTHTIYRYIAHSAVEGFTTVILLLLIIGSMLMISLGMLGLYVAKIYEEIKGRPIFLVQHTINLKNNVKEETSEKPN